MTMDRHDPLTALAEDSAEGRVAELFHEIRSTMQIPFLTSIWRILAADVRELEQVWSSVRPLYSNGQVDASWEYFQHCFNPHVDIDYLATEGGSLAIDAKSAHVALALLRAYNRSNGMNFIALTALLEPPAAERVLHPFQAPVAPWPKLPPLQAMAELTPAVQQSILDLNQLGQSGDEVVVATLWRHLASGWPELLRPLRAALAPLDDAARLSSAISDSLISVAAEGSRLAASLPAAPRFAQATQELIRDYVKDPRLVARMVVIGIIAERLLARWCPIDQPFLDTL